MNTFLGGPWSWAARGYAGVPPAPAGRRRDWAGAGRVLIMTDPDDLDSLSSRELHDLAVHRARRHLDLAFLWELLRALPAGEIAAGHPDHARADALKLSALIGDALDADDSGIEDALRPLYLDYLNKHRADLPALQHDSEPHPGSS